MTNIVLGFIWPWCYTVLEFVLKCYTLHCTSCYRDTYKSGFAVKATHTLLDFEVRWLILYCALIWRSLCFKRAYTIFEFLLTLLTLCSTLCCVTYGILDVLTRHALCWTVLTRYIPGLLKQYLAPSAARERHSKWENVFLTLHLAKSKENAETLLKIYEIFIYGDVHYIINLFCKNVFKKPTLWKAFLYKFFGYQ